MPQVLPDEPAEMAIGCGAEAAGEHRSLLAVAVPISSGRPPTQPAFAPLAKPAGPQPNVHQRDHRRQGHALTA